MSNLQDVGNGEVFEFELCDNNSRDSIEKSVDELLFHANFAFA